MDVPEKKNSFDFFLNFDCAFQDRASLCEPDRPGNSFAYVAAVKLRDALAFAYIKYRRAIYSPRILYIYNSLIKKRGKGPKIMQRYR